ncbi:MAG: hypothetical protein M3R10_02610 [Verrucomicrobiota bacterium]|nr:hypothetical protein [Verrucomicrobiota bacterium]
MAKRIISITMLVALIACGTPLLAGTYKSKTKSIKTTKVTKKNGTKVTTTTTATTAKPTPSPKPKAVWQTYRHQTGTNL